MAESKTSPPQDPHVPIAARTFNSTRVAGVVAIVAPLAAALSGAAGGLKEVSDPVLVAAFAVIAVGVAVAGYITVTDMRVRNRQTIADNYIRYMRERPQAQAVPQSNGHEAHLMAAGVPTRVKLVGRPDDPIWNLLAVKVDVVDDALETSFLAGNGQEPPGWFKREHVRVVDQT